MSHRERQTTYVSTTTVTICDGCGKDSDDYPMDISGWYSVISGRCHWDRGDCGELDVCDACSLDCLLLAVNNLRLRFKAAGGQ